MTRTRTARGASPARLEQRSPAGGALPPQRPSRRRHPFHLRTAEPPELATAHPTRPFYPGFFSSGNRSQRPRYPPPAPLWDTTATGTATHWASAANAAGPELGSRESPSRLRGDEPQEALRVSPFTGTSSGGASRTSFTRPPVPPYELCLTARVDDRTRCACEQAAWQFSGVIMGSAPASSRSGRSVVGSSRVTLDVAAPHDVPDVAQRERPDEGAAGGGHSSVVVSHVWTSSAISVLFISIASR
jgi:hypothetical protein